MKMTRAWAMALVCMAAVSGAAFAEQVDNPQYADWAKYKPGTTVTHKTETEMKMEGMPAPMKTEVTSTQKLVEVKPDSITIERTDKMSSGGQEMPAQPPQKMTIPAKVEKGKEMPAPEGAEIKDMKDGTDKVEVGGKTYAAKTKEFTVEMKQPMVMTTKNKIWSSSEVPGGSLKMEMTSAAPMAMTTKTTLVEFKVEK